MIEEPTYEPVDFYDDREELFLDLEGKRRQDDSGIDTRGLGCQQLFGYAVGVTPEVAYADHPHAVQAQYDVTGPERKRRVGDVEIGAEKRPVYERAQVRIVTGFQLNTSDLVALPKSGTPDEFHVTDFPTRTLAIALRDEDRANTAPGKDIGRVRKGRTTLSHRPATIR